MADQNAVLAFGLKQLLERWKSEAEADYGRSRSIRAKQEKDPQTDEMVNVDPDVMYDLGHAEGRSSAMQTSADRLAEVVRLLEASNGR